MPKDDHDLDMVLNYIKKIAKENNMSDPVIEWRTYKTFQYKTTILGSVMIYANDPLAKLILEFIPYIQLGEEDLINLKLNYLFFTAEIQKFRLAKFYLFSH